MGYVTVKEIQASLRKRSASCIVITTETGFGFVPVIAPPWRVEWSWPLPSPSIALAAMRFKFTPSLTACLSTFEIRNCFADSAG